MMLTSFMALPKTGETRMSSAKEFLLIGLPIVLGAATLGMTLLAGVLVDPGRTPEALVANLTSENHLLIALVWISAVSVILLALHNKRAVK